jgi:hypothetical protein
MTDPIFNVQFGPEDISPVLWSVIKQAIPEKRFEYLIFTVPEGKGTTFYLGLNRVGVDFRLAWLEDGEGVTTPFLDRRRTSADLDDFLSTIWEVG